MSNKPSTKEQKSILLKELTKEIKEASTTKAALELLKEPLSNYKILNYLKDKGVAFL